MCNRQCLTKVLLVAGIVIGFSFHARPLSAQNNTRETDTLVRQLMDRLSDADKKGVLIMDLKTSDGQWLDFGGWVADQLASSFAAQGPWVEVVDRSHLATALDDLKFSHADEFILKNQIALGKAIGANTIIAGSYGAMDDDIGVTLAVFHMSGGGTTTSLFITGKIPLTQDARSHLGVSLDSLRRKDGIYLAGIGGVTVPTCVKCTYPTMHVPDVDLPAMVRDNRHEGDVLLQFVVTSEGRATQISTPKPFGYGVDEQYVKAMKDWEFKPATDAEGKPVSVHFQISARVNFKFGPPPSSPAALAAEQPGSDPYSLLVVKDLLNRRLTGSKLSFDDKLTSGLGDKCAIAILKIVARRDLADSNTALIISGLIRDAFAHPEDIGTLSDQQPRVSLFLLNDIHERVSDVTVQEQIQKTIEFLNGLGVPTSAVPTSSSVTGISTK
jgi:TonB family protein